jgi:macrolide phosphotransferase
MTTTNSKETILALAARHGLRIVPESIRLNDSGMDFLVAFGEDVDGTAWVLRQPRRDDVWERAENERKALALLQERLPVQVPDWRVCDPEFIAYPLLDGEPIGTVDPAGGGYLWKIEQASLPETFFDSLAETLAGLHNVDAEAASNAGVRVKRPSEARQAFADHIEEIRGSFEIPP